MSNSMAHPMKADPAVRINNETFSTILRINLVRFERRRLARSLALQVHLSPEVSLAWHSNREIIVNNNNIAKSKPIQAK